MLRFLRLFVVPFILLALATPAGANTAPTRPVAGGVEPVGSTHVRLESERIEMQLYRKPLTSVWWSGDLEVRVRVHFRFMPEQAETLRAGFPLGYFEPERGIYGMPYENFEARANGKALAVTEQPGSSSRWATYDLEFRKGQPLELDVTYTMRVVPAGKGNAGYWLTYILRTGAMWAGTIGRAEAVFSADRPLLREDIQGDRNNTGWGTTPGWTLKDGVLFWEWREFEPDFDLHVYLNNFYFLDSPAELAALAKRVDLSRLELLQLVSGATGLFAGDGRFGQWETTRGGVLGPVAAEKFLPDIMQRLDEAFAGDPMDWELRKARLRMLFQASWKTVMSPDGFEFHLYHPERYRLFLAGARQYRQDGGPDPFGMDSLPWFQASTPNLQLDEKLQAEVVAYLTGLMYDSFPTPDHARNWVASATRQLPPVVVAAVEAVALQRVKQTSDPAAPAPHSSDIAAPTPAARPPLWLLIAVSVAVGAATAGVALYRRRRSSQV